MSLCFHVRAQPSLAKKANSAGMLEYPITSAFIVYIYSATHSRVSILHPLWHSLNVFSSLYAPVRDRAGVSLPPPLKWVSGVCRKIRWAAIIKLLQT